MSTRFTRIGYTGIFLLILTMIIGPILAARAVVPPRGHLPYLLNAGPLLPPDLPTPTPTPVPTPPPPSSAKLGLGMTFDMGPETWLALGRPHLYSWNADPSYVQRFGRAYTPMMWGCRDRDLEAAIAWPVRGDYLLFLNEPESRGQANCPPEKAAHYLHALITARPDLRILVGGVKKTWSWPAALGRAYFARYGDYPRVAGIHIHAYTWSQPDAHAHARALIMQINGWKVFQDRYPWARGELWVTEVGVLETQRDFAFSQQVMEEVARAFARDPRVNRLYWFASEGKAGVPNVIWRPTMLIWEGERTPLWDTFRRTLETLAVP